MMLRHLRRRPRRRHLPLLPPARLNCPRGPALSSSRAAPPFPSRSGRPWSAVARSRARGRASSEFLTGCRFRRELYFFNRPHETSALTPSLSSPLLFPPPATGSGRRHGSSPPAALTAVSEGRGRGRIRGGAAAGGACRARRPSSRSSSPEARSPRASKRRTAFSAPPGAPPPYAAPPLKAGWEVKTDPASGRPCVAPSHSGPCLSQRFTCPQVLCRDCDR